MGTGLMDGQLGLGHKTKRRPKQKTNKTKNKQTNDVVIIHACPQYADKTDRQSYGRKDILPYVLTMNCVGKLKNFKFQLFVMQNEKSSSDRCAREVPFCREVVGITINKIGFRIIKVVRVFSIDHVQSICIQFDKCIFNRIFLKPVADRRCADLDRDRYCTHQPEAAVGVARWVRNT